MIDCNIHFQTAHESLGASNKYTPDGLRFAIHSEPRRKYFYVGGDCERGGINSATTKGAFNVCGIYSTSVAYWYIGASLPAL